MVILTPINFIFDQVMTREAMEIEYDEKSRLYPGASYPEAEHTLKGPMEIDIILRGEPEQPVAGLSQTADDDASDSETEGGSDDAPLAISSSSSMDDASGANDGSAGDSSIHTNLSDQVAGHPLLMLVLSLFALFIVPFSKR